MGRAILVWPTGRLAWLQGILLTIVEGGLDKGYPHWRFGFSRKDAEAFEQLMATEMSSRE